MSILDDIRRDRKANKLLLTGERVGRIYQLEEIALAAAKLARLSKPFDIYSPELRAALNALRKAMEAAE